MPRSDIVAWRNGYFLKISLGSVMLPMETDTSSQPLMPNSFSLVCMFMVSGNTSTILYSNRLGSCALGVTGFNSNKMQVDTSMLIPTEIIMTRPWFIPPPLDLCPMPPSRTGRFPPDRHSQSHQGCAARQFLPTPTSTLSGTDNANCLPTP